MTSLLEIDFAGIKFKNPFMLSSAPPTTNGEMIERAFEEGWGGAVIKTMAYDLSQTQNVNPRMHSIKRDGVIHGFANFELGSPRLIETWLEDIRRIKKNYPDNVLLASLLHTEGLIKEQWTAVAKNCTDAGVDGFELNFSCSHGMAESGGGATIGGSDELIKKVVGWVREATELPIMTKIPAMVSDLPGKAAAAKDSGASAVSTINTLNCISDIDIYSFVPYPNVGGKSAYCGVSGPIIKPIGLRCVAQIASAVEMPISASGGVSNWEDAVQYILVGATTIQVCSAVMQYGYRIINDLKQGLTDYMERMNFRSINEFRGLALRNITKHNNLSRDYKVVSSVDKEKCVGCGICFVACRDNGYQAIEMAADRIPTISATKCDGCGLCIQVCPVQGCLTLEVNG